MEKSRLAENMNAESEDHLKSYTSFACPIKTLHSAQLITVSLDPNSLGLYLLSHIIIFVSSLPVAKYLPFGLNLTQFTVYECPVSTCDTILNILSKNSLFPLSKGIDWPNSTIFISQTRKKTPAPVESDPQTANMLENG